MPSSVVFHGEFEKNMKNSKKNTLPANLALNVDIWKKTSIFVLSGPFLGSLWLSLALKNLVKLSNTSFDHWNNKNPFSC
jgi:hypothetical protein